MIKALIRSDSMGYLLNKELIAVMKLGAAAMLASSALTDMEERTQKTSGLSTTLRYRRKIREQEKIIKVLGETVKDLKNKVFNPKTLEEMVNEGRITPEIAEEVKKVKEMIERGNHR